MQVFADLTPNEFIIREVKKHLNNTKEINQILAKHLNLSKSAIYRKLSSEVPFTFQEAITLAKIYGISIDNCIHGGSSCTGFQFPFSEEKKQSDVEYFSTIFWILKVHTNAKNNPQSEIFTLTQEIMPFQYLYFPELTSFQILLWSKATMRLRQTEEQSYKVEERSHAPEMRAIANDILKTYIGIPSTEFMSSSIIDQNLNAIVQFARQPYFEDKQTPLLLCEQLEQLVKYKFNMAKIGEKFDYNAGENSRTGVPFTLYHDPLANYGTIMYFKSNRRKTVYNSLDFPNFMSSSAENMLKYTEGWINNCRSHSFRISGEGEMYRTQLLQTLLKKIETIKKQL